MKYNKLSNLFSFLFANLFFVFFLHHIPFIFSLAKMRFFPSFMPSVNLTSFLGSGLSNLAEQDALIWL